LVAGVIPCRGGWLVASAKLQGVTIAPGGRAYDREARALLGPRRGAAVRSAPSWAAFEAQASRQERRELLVAKVPDVERILDANVATPAHLLDAAACLWTARRTIARAATRMPADPEWDNQGLRMEFVR
jgi:predicted RNase H-like nuclease